MRYASHAFAAFLVSSSIAISPAGANLIHDYEFATDLSDSVSGGTALSLSSDAGGTGSVTAGFYNFTPGGGLVLSSQLPGSVYTIDMRVSLDTISGYRKLVSFNDISSDLGLYNFNGLLDLFDKASSLTNTDIAANTFADVRISRNGTDDVTGFVNGVQKFSYHDTGNLYTAATALYFLRDDTDQNSEQSAGSADFIRIYDTAAPTTGGGGGAVPEPTTWMLMISGFGLVGVTARRRQRATVRFA
jgi:hypothetical protein